jgi:nucleoside-diphosphate-sugar epimerase
MSELLDQLITPEVRMVLYLMVACLVMLYILSIVYVIRDAQRRGAEPWWLWAVISVIPVVGLLAYVILRPTGVYGPRERDYFLMAKSIKQHSDFAVGYQQQDITFVYVLDVVQAVFLACEKGQTGRKYFLSDGEVYQSTTFSDLIRKELGNPLWIRITAPIWVLRVITFFGDKWGHITGKISALNNDKYHILKQRNWRCDIEPARRELGYEPKYTLEKGVPLTIKWYKENGWL